MAHICYCRGVEIRDVEFRQTRAIIEHRAHICHRRGVEIRDVERCQTRTTIEHSTHTRHRGGVEIRDVGFRQTRATREHITHIRYCRGIEVLKAFDSGERFEIRKPRVRSGRSEILERSIKHNFGDNIIGRFICSRPARS